MEIQITNLDILIEQLLRDALKEFEKRNLINYIASRYNNGDYEIVLLCDIGYRKSIADIIVYNQDNIKEEDLIYPEQRKKIIDKWISKIASENQYVKRLCPVDKLPCINSKPCFSCKLFSERITEEVIEDNKKENGAR